MKSVGKHTTYGKHRETCLMQSALKYCAKVCEVTSAIYGKREQTMENKRNELYKLAVLPFVFSYFYYYYYYCYYYYYYYLFYGQVGP